MQQKHFGKIIQREFGKQAEQFSRSQKEKRLVQPRDAEDWMALAQTPPRVKRMIRRLLKRSMRGDATGQNVRLIDERIVFNLNYRIFVLAVSARQIPSPSPSPWGRGKG